MTKTPGLGQAFALLKIWREQAWHTCLSPALYTHTHTCTFLTNKTPAGCPETGRKRGGTVTAFPNISLLPGTGTPT